MNILSKSCYFERLGELLRKNNGEGEFEVLVCDDCPKLEVKGKSIIVPEELFDVMFSFPEKIDEILNGSELNGQKELLSSAILDEIQLKIKTAFEKIKNNGRSKENNLPMLEELPSISAGLRYLIEMGRRGALIQKTKLIKAEEGRDLTDDEKIITNAEALSTYLKGIIRTAKISFSENERSEFKETYESFLQKAQTYAEQGGPNPDEYEEFHAFMEEVNKCIENGSFTVDQYLRLLDAFGEEFRLSYIGMTIVRTEEREKEGVIQNKIGFSLGGPGRMTNIYAWDDLPEDSAEKQNKWNKMFINFESARAVYNRTEEIAVRSTEIVKNLKNSRERDFAEDPLTILDAPVGDGTVSTLVLEKMVKEDVLSKGMKVKIHMRDMNILGMKKAAERVRIAWRNFGFDNDDLEIDQGGSNLFHEDSKKNNLGGIKSDLTFTPGVSDYAEKREQVLGMIDRGISTIGEEGMFSYGQFKPHPDAAILNTFGWPLFLRDEAEMTSVIDDLGIFKDAEKVECECKEGETLHYKVTRNENGKSVEYEVVLSSTLYAENTQWMLFVTKGISFDSTTTDTLGDKMRKPMPMAA